MKSDRLTVQLPDGSRQIFSWRDAWTLRHLIDAGSTGLTPLDHPAPQWSLYVDRLRHAGLSITTKYEPRSKDYAGIPGRYRLETPVIVVTEASQ